MAKSASVNLTFTEIYAIIYVEKEKGKEEKEQKMPQSKPKTGEGSTAGDDEFYFAAFSNLFPAREGE